MRVLFLMRNTSYLRLFEPVIRALALRGHAVSIAADQVDTFGGETLGAELAADFPSRVTLGRTPDRFASPRYRLSVALSRSLDVLHFQNPLYHGHDYMRKRIERRSPVPVLKLLRLPPFRGERGRERLSRWLRALERASLRSPRIRGFIREQAPDVVVVTPLIDRGYPQFDQLAAAQALGIPTVLAVASWDNLTTKSIIRPLPDRVLVWNGIQKDEAVSIHGVPPEKIVVTGAQCYDHWFDWKPSTSRDEFCRKVALDPARPFLLCVCSSLFDNVPEWPYLREWLRWVRPLDAGVLIRPHPVRSADFELSEFRNVAVWPKAGTLPLNRQAKSDYFDSLHHSAGVVGINTSALLESAIVGRPVHTFLNEEWADHQQGTIHFHYLTRGGFLHVARTREEHLAQLAETAAGKRAARAETGEFVRSFLRPHGIDEPATPFVVEAIESLVRPAPRPLRPVPQEVR
jgi:hypothetical protein